MKMLPSVCSMDTFLITALGNKPTPHKINTAATHGIRYANIAHPTMIGYSASARRATAPGDRRKSGWAVARATCSSTNQTASHTTHDTGHRSLHTPDKNLVLGKREGGKGYHSGRGHGYLD